MIKDINRARECRRNRDRKWRLSKGLGVYLVKYPSGIYVGSGQIAEREKRHLRGLGILGKKLGEKAISFKVVASCETKNECLVYEDLLLSLLSPWDTLNTKQISE